MEKLNLSDLVKKDLIASFEFYRDKKLYYSIYTNNKKYRFPIPVEDSGSGNFNSSMKTVELMRWIRKAIENEEIYIEDAILNVQVEWSGFNKDEYIVLNEEEFVKCSSCGITVEYDDCCSECGHEFNCI